MLYIHKFTYIGACVCVYYIIVYKYTVNEYVVRYTKCRDVEGNANGLGTRKIFREPDHLVAVATPVVLILKIIISVTIIKYA